MAELDRIFSSASRTRVLQTLFAQDQPIHLRLLTALADCPVHSIECAVSGLQKERFVVRRRTRQRTYYSLNREHPAYPLLEKIFLAATAHNIQKRSGENSRRAQSFLRFMTSTKAMIDIARQTSDGSR